jgi:hypothetical protein
MREQVEQVVGHGRVRHVRRAGIDEFTRDPGRLETLRTLDAEVGRVGRSCASCPSAGGAE